jgi:riboflavin kinase / FMN adenylyltransferase
MKIHPDLRKIRERTFEKPVVTSGSFDGLHLGHQAIIKRLKEKSKEMNQKAVVLTYEPHPQSVVAPVGAPLLLTTLEEKLMLMEKMGVEEIVVMDFDRELKEYPAEEFIERILAEKLDVGGLVVGNDHAFGKNRSGGMELLKKTSEKFGFDLEVVPAQHVNGIRISSSQIRKKLKAGEFSLAIAMLGHAYPLSGNVITGKGRGKSLDYPTLNLEIHPRKLLPADGVYSARVQLGGKSYVGMLYIGPRPTFGEDDRMVEIHVFGLDQNVVGSQVQVQVESWVREPMAFPDPNQLKAQIKSDEKEIKRLFHINSNL